MSDEVPEYPVYYKVYAYATGGLAVVCMQEFDEKDYDQSRFLSQFRYPTEKDASEVVDGFKRVVGGMVLRGMLNG